MVGRQSNQFADLANLAELRRPANSPSRVDLECHLPSRSWRDRVDDLSNQRTDSGNAPEDRIAVDMATTKSMIPRIFQIKNRRLAANNGLRTRLSTIHGALNPIAMSPRPAGRANSPGKIPFA